MVDEREEFEFMGCYRMSSDLCLQADDGPGKGKEATAATEEVDPQEVFRQLVLDGTSLSLSLCNILSKKHH